MIGRRCIGRSGFLRWFWLSVLFVVILAPVGVLFAGSSNSAGQMVSAKSSGWADSKVGKVLLITYPLDSLDSQVIEDILTTELMLSRVAVVSREQRSLISAEQLSKQGTPEPEKDSSEAKDDTNEEILDITRIARAAGADAIITLTMLGQVVQRNVFDSETGQVTEVHSEQLVRAISMTLVGVDKGQLLAAGYASYPSPLNIAEAASHVGKEIVKIIQK